MTRRDFFASGAGAAAAASTPPAALGQATTEAVKVPLTSIHRVQADGVTVFYREAGPKDAPVVLLLHGFPASSFQYR